MDPSAPPPSPSRTTLRRSPSSPSTYVRRRPSVPTPTLHDTLLTAIASASIDGPRRTSDPTDLSSPDKASFDPCHFSNLAPSEASPSRHDSERRPSLQFRRSPSSILEELSFDNLPSGLDRLVASQDASRKAASVPASACSAHASRSAAASPSEGEPDTPLASRAAFVSRNQSTGGPYPASTRPKQVIEDEINPNPSTSFGNPPPVDQSSSSRPRLRTLSRHSFDDPLHISSNNSSIDHGSSIWSKVHYNPRLADSVNISASAISAAGGSTTYATTPETESDDPYILSSHSRSHSNLSSHPRQGAQLSQSHSHHSHSYSQSIDISNDPPLPSSPPVLPTSLQFHIPFSPNPTHDRRQEADHRLDAIEQQSLRDHYRHVFLNHTRPIGRDDGIMVATQPVELQRLAIPGRKERRASNNNLNKGTGELSLGLGSFGAALREEVSKVLGRGLQGVALSGQEGEVVGIVEYGCLHGQSFSLIPAIISTLLASSVSKSQPCFNILHQDHRLGFSTYQQTINSSDLSYLHPTFLNTLSNGRERVFSSIATKPFGSLVVPPATVFAGFSLLDLHWLHSSPRNGMSASMAADEELRAFLSARAKEFKPTGLLVLGFLLGSGRSSTASGSNSSLLSSPVPNFSPDEHEETTILSPVSMSHRASLSAASVDCSPHRSFTAEPNIWRQLSSVLSTCITRLVGFQKIKASVAPRLLSLNLWTRSEGELRRSLSAESVTKDWEIVETRGLGQPGDGEEEGAFTLRDEGPVSILHPAERAFMLGTVSRSSWSEHIVAFTKIIYEHHFLEVLITYGGLSRGTAESTVYELFSILHEKCDDGFLDSLSCDFATVSLRRR